MPTAYEVDAVAGDSIEDDAGRYIEIGCGGWAILEGEKGSRRT